MKNKPPLDEMRTALVEHYDYLPVWMLARMLVNALSTEEIEAEYYNNGLDKAAKSESDAHRST